MKPRRQTSLEKRYGLEPLPADATDAQRRERLDELRVLRNRRRRRIAARTGFGMLLLVIAIGVLGWWLLTTIGGRNVLLAQIVARLPAGTTLSWERAEGPASGPLTLHGLRFSTQRQRDPDCKPTATASCAMGTIVFTADSATIDPALRPLLGRRLRLDALAISDATLELPRSDEPFELPRWPDVLPQIEPPLALDVADIRIDRLQVTQEGEPLVAIASARGGLHAQHGLLELDDVRVDSDRGRFVLAGSYAPREDYRMDLSGTAVLPAPRGDTAPRLGLIARGDLSRMDIAIGGRAPAPLRAGLELRGKDRPQWSAWMRSDALDPGLLAGAGQAGTPLALDLSARGVEGAAQLQGNVRQGEFGVAIQPSKVTLDDQVLDLHPLVVDVLGGRVTANGRANLRDPADASLKFAVNARGLRWSDADGRVQVHGDADFGIAGKPEAWAAIGTARLRRDGEHAQVEFDGRGDRSGVRLQRASASMPGGRLDASGRVDWAPRLQWDLDTRLAGFDPGWFAPDWPGAVNGRIATRGELRERAGLLASFDAGELGGSLRGRPLSGQADVQVDGDAYSGNIALALGRSRIDARGSIAGTLDIDARLSPLHLDDLWPRGAGTLAGTVDIRGPRNAPDIAADLRGNDLRWGDWRAGSLHADGRLPWRGGGGSLRIAASALEVGIALDRLDAVASGAMEDLQLEGHAQGALGQLQFGGSARNRGGAWSGALGELAFAPARGARWILQQPAQWRQQGTGFALTPACFASGAGGQLCVDGQWPQRGVQLQGHGLPLALLVPYLPERGDGRPWLFDGEAAIEASVRPRGGSWSGQARVTSAAGALRNHERSRRNLVAYDDLVLDARFDPARLDASVRAGLAGNGRLDARVQTGWDEYAPIAGHVDVDTSDLVWMELFSPDIVEPSGQLQARLQLGGTRGAPALGGDAHLRGFGAEIPELGLTVHDGDLRLNATADGNARLVGSLRSGDGRLEVSGDIGWRQAGTPVDLRVRGTDVLVADTRQLRALANPDLRVRTGPGAPIEVSGTVTIPAADVHLERLDMTVKPSADVVVLDPATPPSTAAQAPSQLALDLTLVMGDAVDVDGYGLDGTLGGQLRVRQSPGGAMLGHGQLTVDGRYEAYGQRLQIEDGRLLWAGDAIGNPRLDLRAIREVGDVTAGIRIDGRASAPRATVYTDPASNQSDALAYLTMGRPLSSLTGAEARQVGTAQSALNAGTGMLLGQLGSRIGLDDAGVSTSRALGGEVLGVGKYLSPKLYVGYGVSLLGTGQVLTLRYLLRKGFDIEIESSTAENRGSVNWRKEK